jgi:hypothetical protein
VKPLMIQRPDTRSTGSQLSPPNSVSQCVDKFVREKVNQVGTRFVELHAPLQCKPAWGVRIDGLYIVRNEITVNPNGRQPMDKDRKRAKTQLNVLYACDSAKAIIPTVLDLNALRKTHEVAIVKDPKKFSDLLSAPPVNDTKGKREKPEIIKALGKLKQEYQSTKVAHAQGAQQGVNGTDDDESSDEKKKKKKDKKEDRKRKADSKLSKKKKHKK